jgi:outer membrane protein OmpA-like peptidoglycan-associated protein
MSGYGDVQSGMFEGRVELNVYLGGWMDTDGDGIEDKQDLSPKEAEDFDGFQDMDGKPDLDNDNDGIPDTDDKSPNEAEDKDGFQDEDGTPDPDNDSDGIPDAQDKAPNDPEDKDGFQDEDGQPDPDNDSDGIPDTNDECPNEPETFNDFEDEDGCPDKKPEVVIDTQAPIVLEGVTFNSGSNVLTPEAKTVLDRVYRTLVDYPEMTVEVRGHTDNTGSYDLNMRLSVYRADAVKSYLVSKGVDSIRINAVGFGPDKPIAPNSTIEGRALNRRIEFIRIK